MPTIERQDTIEIAPLGHGDGVVVTPRSARTRLADLHGAGLDGLVERAGHILIRGFCPTVEDFNALVAHYSSRVTLDPARVFHGDAAQKVDSGVDAIGLHLENGATPFAADLLWFACLKAASSGSETTVCDGFRVWDRLTERSRELFTAQPLTYSRAVPGPLWRAFGSFLAADGRTPEQMTLGDLDHLTSAGALAQFTLDDDDSLTYVFTAHAAHPTRTSQRLAWANSILGPSFNYEQPDIRFADGSPIPGDVVADYLRVTAEETEEIDWQDGDVVLIDNTRVMHGRRAIEDPERSILNAQSYAGVAR